MNNSEVVFEAAQLRIDALERLSACYHIGRRPSDTLLADLKATLVFWKDIVTQRRKLTSGETITKAAPTTATERTG